MRSLSSVIQALPYAVFGGLVLAFMLKQLGLFGGQGKTTASNKVIGRGSPLVCDSLDTDEVGIPTGMDVGLAFVQHSIESCPNPWGDSFNPYTYLPAGMDPDDPNDVRCFPHPEVVFDSQNVSTDRV